jgi:hypothetical protein
VVKTSLQTFWVYDLVKSATKVVKFTDTADPIAGIDRVIFVTQASNEGWVFYWNRLGRFYELWLRSFLTPRAC